jgi:hypothetical protein
VSGNVQIPDGGKAENLRLRQIANNRGAIIRTFSKSSGTGPILLHKVSVDRNGEASGCVVSKCAGIWIANVDEVTLEDVEVFGNGRGVGIAVTDATNVVLRDIYVHDMHWSALEDPNTEQIVGVWPIRVNGLVAYHVRVSNLQGRIDEGALLPYQTDCFDFSAVSGAVVVGSELSTCGEGVDISSAGNQKIWLIDTRYRDIDSWPEKWGSASHSGSIGSQSKNSGLGFVIYSQPNLPATTSIHIYDAVAANVGFNHRWPNQAGFRVIARSKGAVVPLDSQCIRCSAIDSGRTMAFGFMVDPGASLRMVQSRAEGFTRAYAHIAGYEVSKSELK